MSTVQDVVAFEKRHNVTLPEAHAQFLTTFDQPSWYLDPRGMRVRFAPLTAVPPATEAGVAFGMEAPIPLNGKPVPFLRLLTPHFDMWREFTGQDYFDHPGHENFTADKIASAVCIGEDDNGELIFLSGKAGSVWAFFHDGCQVEMLADSFEKYLATCQPE